MIKENLVEFIQGGITRNWESKAMSDYRGESFTYADVARRIVKLQLVFEACKLEPGDKVALIGKNSSHWAISYLATITYGAVIVPILPDFKPNDIHHIVNHSDASVLLVADNLYESLHLEQMKNIRAVFSLKDFSMLAAQKPRKLQEVLGGLNGLMKKKYPRGFKSAALHFKPVPNDKLAVISYTSGTTGFTKGVMLSHNNLLANVVYANHNMPLQPGDAIVSFLPLAHAYGCAFEFLWPFTLGCHIHFLTKTPSPQIILQAFREVKPRLVLSVPLIMEKIYKKQILPALNKASVKMLLKVPVLDYVIEHKIRKKLSSAFGGNFHEVVIGGAALSQEVETFLHKIRFPYAIGYGMTECAPLISYANWDKTRLGSAGKVVDSLEIKIHEPDPNTGIGEIMVRGENVMQGYYKNPEATQAVMETDGWMHTGDLGYLDDQQFVFIKGRSKTMILGPSGQNIFPEEIEARFNNMDYIQESLVCEKSGKMTALIYPDYELVDKHQVSETALKTILENHRKEVNQSIPSYMAVAAIRIVSEEFEKTPKKSIKRFLYT